MSLNTASLQVKLEIRDQIDSGAIYQSDIDVNFDSDTTIVYTPGTAANEANKSAYYKQTLASTTQNIDLSTMVCSDGSTGFSHVRSIVFVNLETTDGRKLIVGGASSNGFTYMFADSSDKACVEASSRWVAEKPIGTTGYLVDGTHKILKVDSGANTVQYEIYILGDY